MGRMLTTSLRILFLVLFVSFSNSEAIKLKRVYSKESCSNPNSECARQAKKPYDSDLNEVESKIYKPSQANVLTHQVEDLQTTIAVIPPRESCTSVGPDACADKQGFDAISALHRQLDDDANGNIDIDESDEFLRDELQYENGYERQKTFHGNDKHITVDELWKSWKLSEVHNWTVEETVKWLVQHVELAQYSHVFHEFSVNGSHLPAMAVPNTHYLTHLGIKDPIHKQKIALKAMDVVLFGPPRHHNYVKDCLLVVLLLLATGGCWFAFVQHKSSQKHLRKMMRDMDSLQHAEEALKDMQVELERAKKENSEMNSRLLSERSLNGMGSSPQRIHKAHGDSPDDVNTQAVQELEEELQGVREELRQAETALEARAWSAPPALQRWLQLTYEIEQRHYNAKKQAAEQQLAAAKEGCEKIRKRRTSFLGTFRIAHGSVIDDVDTWILQAKAALSEVTKDLQERVHRWRQIELLCNTSIVQNPGLVRLEAMLRGTPHAPNGNAISAAAKALSVRSSPISRSCSEGTLLEEELSSSTSQYPTISAVQALVHRSACLLLSSVPPACLQGGRFSLPGGPPLLPNPYSGAWPNWDMAYSTYGQTGSSLVHLGQSYLNSTSPLPQQQLNSSNQHSQVPFRPNALGLTIHHPLHQLEEEAATEDEVDNGELDYYYEDQRNTTGGNSRSNQGHSPEDGARPVFTLGRSNDSGSPTCGTEAGIQPSSGGSILRSRMTKCSNHEQTGTLRAAPLVAVQVNNELSCSESALEVSSTSESSSSFAASPSSSSSIGVSQQPRYKKTSSGNLVTAFKNSMSGGGSSLDETETDSSSEKTRKKSSSILSKLKRKSKAH